MHEARVDMLNRLHVYDQIYVKVPSPVGPPGGPAEPRKHGWDSPTKLEGTAWESLSFLFFFRREA